LNGLAARTRRNVPGNRVIGGRNIVFRTRAVRKLLLEDIAGISQQDGEDEPEADDSRAVVERAKRRALLVVILDWTALLVLVLARARSGEAFAIGPNEESIFSLGLLAIAVHSGFRLGQLEKLHAVGRSLDDLAERSEPTAGPSAHP